MSFTTNFSSDHCDCDRKRVAKQGRRKKKADILFNLAMSGGMSGVTNTITIIVTLNQSLIISASDFPRKMANMVVYFN